MRVGLRLEGTSCRAVVLDGRTVVSAGREVHAGSLPEALESSLSGLRREFGPGITEITADTPMATLTASIFRTWRPMSWIASCTDVMVRPEQL